MQTTVYLSRAGGRRTMQNTKSLNVLLELHDIYIMQIGKTAQFW